MEHQRKQEPVEERLQALGVNVYDIRHEDAYLRAVELLNRTENRLSNAVNETERKNRAIGIMNHLLEVDRDLIALLTENEPGESIYIRALDNLAKSVHDDAQTHGLYNAYARFEDPVELRRALAARIGMECGEAHADAEDQYRYSMELADIVIMALSAAEHLGIDIGMAVSIKRRINQQRPYNHGKDDGAI